VFFVTFIKRLRFAFQQFQLTLFHLWESPFGSALVAGIVYIELSAATGALFSPSKNPYYNYLADAFLHGQTWLRLIPPSTHDLIFFGGKYFLYWAPFPALVSIPFIALFGVNFNDVIFTAIIAALNVGLIAQLLRAACQRGLLHISKVQRGILVLFFAFGTVHLTLAPYGKVWSTGQLIGFTCTILAYLAAFSILKTRAAWWWTGLALAAAMLTRINLVFTGIFPIIYLIYKEKPWDWSRVIQNFLLAAVPIITATAFLLLYNITRFGGPFNFGLEYHLMDDLFKSNFDRYGYFNIIYAPVNIYYQYIFYPFPLRAQTKMGGSLFLLSPLFFGAFLSFKNSSSKWIPWVLLSSILITNIPILLIMGTGWLQFGPRYTLDFTVPLLLLTALGIEKWKPSLLFILALASIIQFTIGVFVIK
jgi:hypothetical protein